MQKALEEQREENQRLERICMEGMEVIANYNTGEWSKQSTEESRGEQATWETAQKEVIETWGTGAKEEMRAGKQLHREAI